MHTAENRDFCPKTIFAHFKCIFFYLKFQVSKIFEFRANFNLFFNSTFLSPKNRHFEQCVTSKVNKKLKTDWLYHF